MSFYIKRRDRIIQTAIEILDELGFQGLSTKEISKRQEISEGTLYKHFKNKDEIMNGVLDYYAKFDSDLKQTIELKQLNSIDSIMFITSCFAEYYQNDPPITAIPFMHEVFRHEKGFSNKMNEILEGRYRYLLEVIERGKTIGEFPQMMDSELLANILLGTGWMIIMRWRMCNYVFNLRDTLIESTNLILQNIKA